MTDDDLLVELAQFTRDPLGYVLFAYPWGEPGELEKFAGPELWQREWLAHLGDRLRANAISLAEAIASVNAIQIARTSGHGIGKSALVSWLIDWAMSTHEDTLGVVTANTENQLKTKTWAQLAKWHRLSISRQLFNMTATALYSRDPEHERTWRIDMVPWSERNTEAFAGMHNQSKRILIVFDEASAIPDTIWEVTEGALTDKDTEIIWAVFGNPTRNTGRFRECFKGGKFAHRWDSAAIDSRAVSFTDKDQIQRWIDDYGEDSDFVRVRVRGVFPRTDSTSFIALELAQEAVRREVVPQYGHPVVLGVDPSRFGDDPAVIYPRCGKDARTRPPEVYDRIDTMELVAKVTACYHKYSATMIFVDTGGVGGGVADRLRQLQYPVIDVDFSSKPDGILELQDKPANKRAEIWMALKDFLKTGAIPEKVQGSETTLVDELTGPSYGLNAKEAILLESKKDMRRRGVPSPNLADALAVTFAVPVYVPPVAGIEVPKSANYDYDPYSEFRRAS